MTNMTKSGEKLLEMIKVANTDRKTAEKWHGQLHSALRMQRRIRHAAHYDCGSGYCPLCCAQVEFVEYVAALEGEQPVTVDVLAAGLQAAINALDHVEMFYDLPPRMVAEMWAHCDGTDGPNVRELLERVER